MFSKGNRAVFLVTFVFLLASTFSLPAHADTYAIFNIGNANEGGVVGIDDAGTVVVTAHCLLGTCFNVFADGVFSYQTYDLPALDFDNGTPCKPVPASLRGACNNGHEAYFGMFFDPSGSIQGIGMFTGPDPVTDFLHNGSGDRIVINALGDVAWIDGAEETNWEAVDLTSRQAPEPSTFALLGIGILGLAGAARRKFVGLRAAS
jgi:hypothetical protein